MNLTNKAEWTAEVNRLKAFFEQQALPTTPFELNPATKIFDLKKAVSTMLLRAEENVGNHVFLASILELQQIESKLKEQQ